MQQENNVSPLSLENYDTYTYFDDKTIGNMAIRPWSLIMHNEEFGNFFTIDSKGIVYLSEDFKQAQIDEQVDIFFESLLQSNCLHWLLERIKNDEELKKQLCS